jgi:hypothetical protein
MQARKVRKTPWDAVFWFCIRARLQSGRKELKEIGLQPLLWRILHGMLVRRQAKKKGAGAKAQIFAGPQRPD